MNIMPTKKEKENVELFPYDDFSFMDDEEAFRELCSALNFDAFDDSITSEDILRRKRQINLQSGDFVRNNHNSSQSQIYFDNNIVMDKNNTNSYAYSSFPTTLPPGSYYHYPGSPIQNCFNATVTNNTHDNNSSNNNPNNQHYSNNVISQSNNNYNNSYFPMQYSSSENVLYPNSSHPPLYPLQTPYPPPHSMSLSNSDTLTVSSSSSDHMSIASSWSMDPNNLSFTYNTIPKSITNNSNNFQNNHSNVLTTTMNVHSNNNSHTNSNNSSHNNTPRTHLLPPQQSQKQQQQQQFNPHKTRKIVRSLIPSDDIRRKYARLFSDAFNSTGMEELRMLLQMYVLPSCVAIYKYVGNPNPLYGPVYCELNGVEAISNYWQAIFGAVPDSVFEMQESKLRVLANPAHIQNIANNLNSNTNDSSDSDNNAAPVAIVIKFIFSGTKVYRISADIHANVVYSDTTTTAANPTPAAIDNDPNFSNSIITNNINNNHNNLNNLDYDDDDDDNNSPSNSSDSYNVKSEPYAHANPLNRLFKQELSSISTEDSTISTSEEPIIQKHTHQIGLDGCLEKSTPVILLGTMTFFTGPDKKIYRIEVVHCVRS